MVTSNVIKSITTTASVTPEQPGIGVFTAVSAMTLMFEKSYKHLTAKELEWLADGASEKINGDTRALSAMVEGLACMVSSDETSGAFESAGSTSNLLFNLHNQLDAIAGMAEVSERANWHAREAVKGRKAA